MVVTSNLFLLGAEELTADTVVGGEFVGNKFSRTMRDQVIRHVVTLVLHVVAQLVKGRSRDHVALAVNLPSDGGVLRTDVVVTGRTSGGTSVVVNV